MSAPAPDTARLDAGEIFDPFVKARGLLIAVSGGPDSLALLALAAEWAAAEGRAPIHAATFDHGFRPESAAEARLVAGICQNLGVPHATLPWRGPKPATRIQESARARRYQALLDHAASIGASHLLTAHHADDQAETILFRLMRGSGIVGLGGMKTSRPRGGLIHARPLLHVPKTMLIEACRTHGLSFVEDPSNRDPRFARTRMRELTKTLSDGGMKTTDWARLAARARRADEALAAATLQLAETLHVRRTVDRIECDARPLASAPAELVLRLLVGEIARLGHAPRLERAEPLADLLQQRIATNSAFRATLGGTLIDLSADGRLHIGREKPRRARAISASGRDKTAEPHCDVHDDG